MAKVFFAFGAEWNIKRAETTGLQISALKLISCGGAGETAKSSEWSRATTVDDQKSRSGAANDERAYRSL